MNIDALFYWPFLASLLATICAAILIAGTKGVGRRIIRWTTSKFPKANDTDRVREELEGMIMNDMTKRERAGLAVNLLANSRALRRELAERIAAELPHDKETLSLTRLWRMTRFRAAEIRHTSKDHRVRMEKLTDEMMETVRFVEVRATKDQKLFETLAHVVEMHSRHLDQTARTISHYKSITELPFFVKLLCPEFLFLAREMKKYENVHAREAQNNTILRKLLQRRDPGNIAGAK